MTTEPGSTPLDEIRLRAALDELAATDADVAEALARTGYPIPRVRGPGFATLLRIVTAQQLSTKAAAAIWAKLEARLAMELEPAAFLALEEADLRACGFSRQKVLYGQGLARAIIDGALPVTSLDALDEEEAIAAITALKGFGRWSAECYLLFAHGRIDSFPAADLALQASYQRLKRLEARPTERALRELVQPWRPHRGAAALLLWHYYGATTLEDRRSTS